MASLISLVFFACIPLLILGLINPKWVLLSIKNPTRGLAFMVYGGIAIVCVVILGSGIFSAPQQQSTTISGSDAVAPSQLTQPQSTDSGRVTLSKYNQITIGMNLAQVEAILGKGSELSRVEIPGTPVTVMYGWQNSDGSNMNVMLQGDSVTTKAQFGLN